eukprot:1382896-Rhodomonas_salina.1
MEDEKQGGATTISILLNVKGKESHATLQVNVKVTGCDYDVYCSKMLGASCATMTGCGYDVYCNNAAVSSMQRQCTS